MVKTTYALTLFAAVSLAAPVAQLTGRAEAQGSVEHKNIIGDIPLLGPMLAGKQDAKRDEHHNLIDELPVIGKLLGNDKQNQRRDIGKDGISGLPIIGGLFGKHTHTGGENGMNKRRGVDQNYGQNAGQNEGENAGQNAGQNSGQNAGQNQGQNAGQNHDENKGQNEGQNGGQNAGQNGGKGLEDELESSLRGIPIVGNLLVNDQDKQKSGTPAKQLDTRQAGHSKGIFGVLQSLTSSGPVTKSHKRAEELEQLDSAAPNANETKQGAKKTAAEQAAKPSESSGGLLGGLMGKDGLGALKGNAHHGLGLLPMRRDQAPIEGSTLAGVLLEGGALGKVTNFLSGGAMPKPGSSSPSKIGDGSVAGPPDPASGAGPHSGPGLAGEQKQASGAAF
ncbi:hypothetical protein DTO013E5_7562 [Penicillium roqueforti]|uniref:Uncharacterized protein n=1 Tax=Penicillium roqueforti (strain FM164) TaxID=1365484 RepID=W6QT86_PENRF|nr:hypothetical protein CBS147337_5854 [Penicillium roqueforti]CDM37314.1 unnamed protein product [Penicillium roqueforti FM164]KAI2675209.1 hypothetical protein LCP963914a_8612 [Penicillium roqueforti]KAI2697564.1 hypothetical protein CBS147372_7605 [Penicillium roqueforti]KAI2726487.1 hypothetical protein CBS147354_4202 [Penicillium roqueforti]